MQQLRTGVQIMDRNVAILSSGGAVTSNDTRPEKPFYTGALSRAKRADWVRFMVSYFAGQILPLREILVAAVERVSGDVLTVRLQCVPPEQTGLVFGEIIEVPMSAIIEHLSTDSQVAAVTEGIMNKGPVSTVRPHAGQFHTRDGRDAVVWTQVGEWWLGSINEGGNTYWTNDGTERTGNAALDLVEDLRDPTAPPEISAPLGS
jgi:hypothetical protein